MMTMAYALVAGLIVAGLLAIFCELFQRRSR